MTDFERIVSMMERLAAVRVALDSAAMQLGELERDARALANATPLRRQSIGGPCCLARAESLDAPHSVGCPVMQ